MDTLITIAKGTFILLLIIIAVGSVALLFRSIFGDVGKCIRWKVICFSLLVIFVQLFVYIELGKKDAIENRAYRFNELNKWKTEGCPVYDAVCEPRNTNYPPYLCQRKAAVIGRNQVGDTFVQAYGSCVK